jgi:hypothetical protein
VTSATLAMPLPGAATTPESVARMLLQRAQGFLQKWPEGFRGYRARARCDTPGGVTEGGVLVAAGRAPLVELEPPDIRARIRARLVELAEERTPRFFKDGDGRFAVHPEADLDGERWIRVERPGGATRYRLDPRGRIGAIERVARGRRSLTVIEEYARATPGRVLPARRRIDARDLLTGACLGRERLVESHCRVDHVWLPARWEIVAECECESEARALRVELFAHQLL